MGVGWGFQFKTIMTTTKKAKKRFTDEAQILTRIDKLRDRVKKKREAAGKIDGDADALFKQENKKDGYKLRDKATALRNRASIIERDIEALGRKLAEFRTQTLSFIEDKSIPA